MDEKSLLLAKVRALDEQLDWAEASLKTAEIKPRISKAASIGFAILFDQRRKELTQLQKSIPQNGSYEGSWKRLHTVSSSCGELFKECLGFLGGAMLRTAHDDDDICDIADALLDELSRKTPIEWKRVTLLAEAHFFTETTGLIRLPFPDYGIWNLPIAAHELGHFIGPRIPDGLGDFPFQAIIRKLQDSVMQDELEQRQSHLRELFSDLFAVFTLGPAYACSCIILSFDPQAAIACEDGETHPSYGKRVHFILKALGEMSKTTKGNPYKNINNNLKGIWERNLRSAGRENCLDQESIPPLNGQLFELYPIMAKFIPTAKYLGWNRAIELSEEFPLDGNVAEVLKAGDTIADVLNAAWLWRLNQTVENSNIVSQVNQEAFVLCRQIIGRRPLT